MQELAQTVTATTDSALAANRLAHAASTSARHGGISVERMAATMELVKSDALRAAEVAAVIDSVASEAGTLALNAALASARSGEGGREFADAAAEVRALAQRAAGAAREVRELAARSVAEIESCATLALDAGSSMVQVAGEVREVGALAERIGSAGLEQAGSLQEVNQAIVRMDEVTQQNCALVEEAAAAARTLQMQARALSRTVAAFRLDESDSAAPAAEPARKESGVPQQPQTRDLPRERRRHERSHLRLASSRK
jgi:methyl-accepting chemotaxis protein